MIERALGLAKFGNCDTSVFTSRHRCRAGHAAIGLHMLAHDPPNRALLSGCSLVGSTALARALTYIIKLAVVGAIYFLLVRFGRDLVALYPGAMAISPPAGFALAAVLLGGYG